MFYMPPLLTLSTGCYGFSRRTLQEWEQGRAQPESAVRAYLTVIDRNPRAVEEALRATR